MKVINLNYSDKKANGTIKVPGDKSISHRSVIFGSLAKGTTVIHDFLFSEDCLRTIHIFQQLGVEIKQESSILTVCGKGLNGLKEPEDILYAGNSGTTARLMLGVLAGQRFHSVITGDSSLNNRPMSRVIQPITRMGGKFSGRKANQFLPIAINGSELSGIEYILPVASAQVKSAIILAALHGEGETVIIEKLKSRDHTERMLRGFGGKLVLKDDHIIVSGQQSLEAIEMNIPGDFSSASFFIALAAINPNSEILIKNVGINETRTGFLEVLKSMNAKVDMVEEREDSGEGIGSIRVRTSTLTGTVIEGNLIPTLIDEIPIIALLATQAEGMTIIKNAEELKIKESNRIDTVVHELRKLGANIEATEDGMIIQGMTKLTGGWTDSHHDHRIGMMLAIAATITDAPVILENPSCIKVSYPHFFDDLERVLSKN